MGFSIILNGQKSAIDWVRNLGFSLFMSLLYYKGLDLSNLKSRKSSDVIRQRNIKTGAKYLTIRDGIKEIEQMYKETYKNLIINNFEEYLIPYLNFVSNPILTVSDVP